MADKAIQDLLHKVISSNPRGVMVVWTTADGDKWAFEMAGYERRDTVNLTSYTNFRMNELQRSYFLGQRQQEQTDKPPLMQAPQRSEMSSVPRAVRRAIKAKERKKK